MSSRRFLIPGAVVLVALLLGGIVAVAATRDGGEAAPYRLDVALPEVTAVNRTPAGAATCPTGGRVADGQAAPLAKVEYAPSGTRTTAVLVAPGQLVPFKFLVTAAADAPVAGTIDFQAAWDRGGQRDAGLDGDAQVVCAFVDPTDASSRDEDQKATVVHSEAAPTGNNIVANFSAEGVDPGDRIVIEAWLVARNVIPANSGTLTLALTATDPDTKVSLAREELPFRLEYFDRVDTPRLTVEVNDGDKATRPPGAILYTVTVANPSQNALVPIARVDGFLGVGTDLGGPIVIEDTAGTKTTCAANAPSADQRVGYTCDLGFVNPQEKVVLKITANLKDTVERRYGEEPDCKDRLVDVCHSVVATWKQSETGDGRATAEKPTDLPAVSPLTITKLLNAPAPYAYPGERVTFTYAVTNASTNLIYNQLRVRDTACSPAEFKDGDTNANGRLEPGESFRYECTIDKMDTSLTVSQATVDALLDSGQPATVLTAPTQITLISPKLAVKTNADPNDVQVMRITVTNVSPTGDVVGSPNAPAPAFTDVTVSAIGCSNLNPVSKGVDGKLESGSSFVFTCRVDNAAQPPRVRAYALDPLGSSVTAVPETPKQ